MKDILLSAITGSRAYGLDHAGSDTDIIGVFLLPTVEIAGLFASEDKLTWTDSSPEGDDHTYHEIGKFLRLCLKANPTLTEFLFSQTFEVRTPIGDELLNLRQYFLSEKLRNTYLHFAKNNMRWININDKGYEKKARHTLRLARNGVQLLTTGHLDVRVSDPEEYFELTKMSKEDILTKLDRELDPLHNCKSILPPEPSVQPVSDFLDTVREFSVLSHVLQRQLTHVEHRYPKGTGLL